MSLTCTRYACRQKSVCAPAQRTRACSGASTPRGSPRAWRGGRCRPAAGRVRREGNVLFSDDVPSPCIGTEELCACVAYLECHLHLQLCGHLGLRWRQGRWLDSVCDRRLEASKNLMGRGSSSTESSVRAVERAGRSLACTPQTDLLRSAAANPLRE